MPIFQLTESLSVAAQITPQDIPNLAAQGFTVVVCNRPDGEVPGQATMDEIEAACNAADLLFVRYPVDAMNFPGQDIEGLGALFDDAGQSVLAYCRTGTRSTVGQHRLASIIKQSAQALNVLARKIHRIDRIANKEQIGGITGRFNLIHSRLTRHLAVRAITHHDGKALCRQIRNILGGNLRRNGQRFG